MVQNFQSIDKEWSYRPVLFICVLCFLTFLIWAYFAQINEQVRATGRVVPSGNTRVIQHLEGGIVNDILVDKGQTIKQGDILFYIKNQQAESDQQEVQIALDTLGMKQKRLEAELAEQEILTFTPEEMQTYPEIAESEQQIFSARYKEFREGVDGLQKQIKQKILKLDDLNTTAENLKKELNIAREQSQIKLELRKKGAMSRSQYLDAISAVRNFETRISRIQKEIPIIKSELSEISSQIEERRQQRFSEISEDLNQVKIDRRKLSERSEKFEDQVDRTAIRSPVDGVINEIFINTIGGVIQPGGKLAEIIPVNENLVVEGRISTNDRGKIWPGLPIVAKITAYDYTLYGGIDGELEYVSANSFIDNQRQEYYQIRVSLDSTNFGENAPIYPGMTAEINIIAGKISILHAILKPFWNIRNNALREK